jgi:tetratricopeptide (TPR) repeat protein
LEPVQESADTAAGSVRLGRYLRQLRLGYGYTLRRVEEHSEELGEAIDNSQLSRFEKGKAAPSFEKLRVLARVFNVPVQNFSDVLDLQQYDHLKPREGRPETLFEAGLAAYRSGEYGRSYVIFERLAELSVPGRFPAAGEDNARAHYHMAVALKKMGRLGMAEDLLRRLLRREEAAYPVSLRVRCLLQLSFVYRELGDLYLAAVIARECQQRAREGADADTVAAALNTAGIIEEEQGHHDLAAGHFRAALEALRHHGDDDLMRLTAQVNLGGAVAANGRFRAGIALLKRALHRAREQGFRRTQALALTKLGIAHQRRNETGMAREYLRRSDELAQGGGEPYQDILFINAFVAWQMARDAGRATQERILFGRLKYLRSLLESRFGEVHTFDAIVRGEKRYA